MTERNVNGVGLGGVLSMGPQSKLRLHIDLCNAFDISKSHDV